MVGDMISDVWAGLNAGCRSILLQSIEAPIGKSETLEGRALIVPDLRDAATVILAAQGTPR